MIFKSICLVICSGLLVILLTAQTTSATFDDLCLECLCNATSGCKVEKSRECFSGVCGIFRITQPYWVDAGKYTVPGDSSDSPQAYQNCVTDINCSASTVKGYMARFEQDCDRNGVVDCFDYAAIHILGGYGCGGQLPVDKYNAIRGCFGGGNFDVRVGN